MSKRIGIKEEAMYVPQVLVHKRKRRRKFVHVAPSSITYTGEDRRVKEEGNPPAITVTAVCCD